MSASPRVVLVVLDAFPHHRVNAQQTPQLWTLIEEGGWHPAGGLSDLTAATYPNHATRATGVSTLEHGILTNRVLRDNQWLPAADVGPRTSTLFDGLVSEGRACAALFGDQNLVGTCGAEVTPNHWPPEGHVPGGVARTRAGYFSDASVLEAADSLDLEVDFIFLQLDEVDGVRHHEGPESEAALQQCRATDAALGSFLERLRPQWKDTVVLVVSDHDQEPLERETCLDLRPRLPEAVQLQNQGTAALLMGSLTAAELAALPGIDGHESLDPTHHVVWGPPGVELGPEPSGLKGEHGSPRTRTQLAIVGGGHPAARKLAQDIGRRRPRARDWAGHAAELLQLEWRPGARLHAATSGPGWV